jgi:hypothetical protein
VVNEEQPVSEVNWQEHRVVPGLENLGRAIVDPSGVPSGSPANFEKTRGMASIGEPPNIADVITALAEEFKDI